MTNYNENNSKKTTGFMIAGAVAVAAVAGVILLTDVDLTKTGELPTVSVDGGELPAIDVDVADVKIGSKKVDFKVPTIDVDLPKEGEEADDLADNIDIDVDVDADVRVKPEQ